MSSASASLRAAPAPSQRVRVVTAASLFDGHDAAINIMRRLLQSQGAEVIHLGHDRSVDEIVAAALQEDAHAIAVSSYQGGHVEFFRYMLDRLRSCGAGHIRVYGGGGGTITPEEIAALHDYGVSRIFSPDDGRALGLDGMISGLLAECAERPGVDLEAELALLPERRPTAVARLISLLEEQSGEGDSAHALDTVRAALTRLRGSHRAPVVGLTGTGGAGKSSVVDELVRRFRADFPNLSIGLLLVDPTRRRTGGALLGDRLRLNAIHSDSVFVRSLATRQAHLALSQAIDDALAVFQAAHYDLILVETAGIGQSDSEIVDRVDLAVYVMTPEFGAPSQLEKIDMLDLADLIVLNKFDRQGAADALRDVSKQWRRNRGLASGGSEPVPVYATVARQWDDPGTDRFYDALRDRLAEQAGACFAREPRPRAGESDVSEAEAGALIPAQRARYLSEIAHSVRGYRERSDRIADHGASADALARALRELAEASDEDDGPTLNALRERYDEHMAVIPEALRRELTTWQETRDAYRAEEQSYSVRDREIRVRNHFETLAGSRVPRVSLPRTEAWGELLRYWQLENRPGQFPFTAGVFPFKRAEEDPARMFAGEGGPERTNRRFHLLASGQPAVRLSTAFDSVTLYGRNPDERPDIYGKVGNSGVSICTVDDAKKLYSGFDLCDPTTSVSMTINGPAPTVLAFFLNTAIDQRVERLLRERGELDDVRARLLAEPAPSYMGELPSGHDGVGLGLLGIRGDRAVDPETYEQIKADVLGSVRGTVQADILKEDQAQNTCIFSTEFSLKLMGDIQEYFVENDVRNFYSVSISGYHMAEAGANPITQLAFTLANGFAYCEYYLARGMAIDEFAPNLSFFFSNGLDAEYSVIGRVARRIWAVAMRERYDASERSQKLKYHVQTSGRSLHAQEMAFNDIRTTLQALTALQDHCNSLHTNAYDEAVTTPTEDSVRRALAIQLIINKELGVGGNENPLQGSYLIDELTDCVEEAVLAEFERLSQRGGVLGAMETLYQRSQIQQESLLYETRKHSGELPIVGVNTFENPDARQLAEVPRELMRSSEGEKAAQLENLRAFHGRHADESDGALRRLQEIARSGGNVFAELLETVKVASLGQISEALFDVGGRYRRSM